MNYVGGKFKYLPQILPFLRPENRFVDLFAGGLSVSLNVKAKKIVCNDICSPLIAMYREFQKRNPCDTLAYINQTIKRLNLNQQNEDGYLGLRSHYNSPNRNPLDLFVLMCFGFNNNIRFNARGGFNIPFAWERAGYTASMRENLAIMLEKIGKFRFTCLDFRLFHFLPDDFIYCDPPYSIATAAYNSRWKSGDDLALFSLLENLPCSFALSNVVEHKNKINEPLRKWMRRFNVHEINASYASCNYQSKKSRTREVLITNF